MVKQQAKIKLMQTLLLLLDEQPFEELSISKICKTANVHRSTFYAYFDNQYDLLEESYHYMVTLFQKDIANYQKNLDLSQIETTIDGAYLRPYLIFVKEHQKIFTVYLKNQRGFSQDETFEILFKNTFIPAYQARGISDTKTIRYMSRFYTQGITAIIKEWLEQGCQDSIETIIKIIQRCVLP